MNTDAPDPLSAPLSGHDTDHAPPNPEELAYQRRMAESHAAGQHVPLRRSLLADCAGMFDIWAARKAARVDAVGDHLRGIAPISPEEVTYLVDGGLYYAYVARPGIDDVTSDVGEDSELAAYARLAAYLETDGSEATRNTSEQTNEACRIIETGYPRALARGTR